MADKEQPQNIQGTNHEDPNQDNIAEIQQKAKDSLCQILSDGRLKVGRDIEDIAHEMNVPSSTVASMENGNIYDDMRKVFVRGYLISYGNILGLDKKILLEILDKIYTHDKQSLSKMGYQGYITTDYEKIEIDTQEKKNFARVAIPVVLVALTFASLLYWKLILEDKNTVIISNIDEIANTENNLPEDIAIETDEYLFNIEASNITTDPSKDLPNTNNNPATPLSKNELQFTFTEESWLEVSDNRGRELSWQLYGPGEEVSFNGIPPYKVVIGNARGTIVKYENKEINLSTFSDRSNVARVTIPINNR